LLLQEFLWRTSPSRQFYIFNALSVRSDAKIQIELILQKVSAQLIELRDQLLDIARVDLATIPLLENALEKTIGIVELATLEFNHPLRVRSYQKSNHVPRTAIVSAI